MVLSAFLARETRNDKVKYFYWNISQYPAADWATVTRPRTYSRPSISDGPQSSLLYYHHPGRAVFGLITGTLSELS